MASVASRSGRAALKGATRAALAPVAGPSSSRLLSTSNPALNSGSSTSAPPTDAPPPAVTAPRAGDAPPVHVPPLARADPILYAALRPQPTSAVAALASRLDLLPLSSSSPSSSSSSTKLDPEMRKRRLNLVAQACRHPSYAHLEHRAKRLARSMQFLPPDADVETPGAAIQALTSLVRGGEQQQQQQQGKGGSGETIVGVTDNASLSTLGNSLLGLLGAELLHLQYPHLPTRVLKAALAAHVGTNTLADVAAELGMGTRGLLKWDADALAPHPKSGDKKVRAREGGRILGTDVMAQSLRALIAVIFQELGLSSARHFIQTRLLSRTLDLSSLLKFNDPKRLLSTTCHKYGKERPVSRLLAETGRLSINPVFVVGVFSDRVKLGEGSGSSIRMAEYRAAEDALRRLFLSQVPRGTFDLPSTTLDDAFPSTSPLPMLWRGGEDVVGAKKGFKPQPGGSSEVVFGSRG